MIKRILVDLDDTLNSFTMFLLKQFGCQVHDAFDYEAFPAVGYNIWEAFRRLVPTINRPVWTIPETETAFWQAASDKNICLRAPLSSEAMLILGSAELLVGTNVFICTKPFSADTAAQKLEWIEKHFPDYRRRFVITSDKTLCANPETLLIDDCDENLDSFAAAGGQTLCVPRPWNAYRTINTRMYLCNKFYKLKGGQCESACRQLQGQ